MPLLMSTVKGQTDWYQRMQPPQDLCSLTLLVLCQREFKTSIQFIIPSN